MESVPSMEPLSSVPLLDMQQKPPGTSSIGSSIGNNHQHSPASSSMPSMHADSMPTVLEDQQCTRRYHGDRRLSSESGPLFKSSVGSLPVTPEQVEPSSGVGLANSGSSCRLQMSFERIHTPVARSVSNTSAFSGESGIRASRASIRRASSLECLESLYKIQQRNSTDATGEYQ